MWANHAVSKEALRPSSDRSLSGAAHRYLACRLGVLYVIMYATPYVRTVLRRLAISARRYLSFGFVARVPDFPFRSAMELPIACVALLALHRLVVTMLRLASR